MKIALTTMGCDGGRSGIGQYAIHLLREFSRMHWAEFDVFVHPAEQDAFLPNPNGLRPVLVGDSLRHPVLNLAWHQIALPRICKKNRCNVAFLPAANRRVPFRMPCPAVGTVHDFSSIHIEGKYDPLRLLYIKRVLPRLINSLAHVIADSESTKKDVVNFAGYPADRVSVIPLGLNDTLYYPRDKQAALDAVTAQFDIHPPYILYISRIEHPGKNHISLIEAFNIIKSHLRIPHQLVLAGSDWTRAEDVHARAQKSPYRDDILFTGFVPASILPDLYCGADIFAFPSLYEGFGLPVLEAMACGIPTACSNASSIPEVGGDAVVYFSPHEPQSIADAIAVLIEDPGLRRQCRVKGIARTRQFSWAKTARQTMEVLSAISR